MKDKDNLHDERCNSVKSSAKMERVGEPVETDPLSPELEIKEETPELSFKEKCIQFRSNITVEPMMVLFITSVMISSMSSQNLYLEKACRVNLNFSEEICDALERRETENYTEYETEVQKLTAYISAWKNVAITIIPSTLILFVGAYSDSTGLRKIFIIMPIVGELVSCITNVLHVHFFYELPIEALAFTEAVFPALGGGFCTLFLGIFSFISDVTSPESRTFRMGIANFCLTVGFPLGMGISGVLLKKFGFHAVYVIATILHCFNIAYGCFVLKDPVRPENVIRQKVNFFNLSRARETLSVLCSGSPARNKRIWLLLLTVCMLFGPMYGEIHVLYLSTRFRFNWEAVSFSLYLTYHFIVHSIGTVFSIVVLSRILNWHDSMLGIISTFSKIAGAAVSALAKTGKQFYLGPLLEILNGTSLLALRSMLSKLVTREEQGKINSVIGLAETMMPLVYSPLYTKIYTLTLSFFPGAVFFLSAILTFIPAITFVYLFIEHRRNLKKQSNIEIS